MLEFNLIEILIIYFIVIIGSIIQGSVSMGFALMVTPILIIIEPAFIPGPIMICRLFLSILIIIKEHRSIDFKDIKISIIGRVIGTLVAAFIILIISEKIFEIVFAGFIILAVIFSFNKNKLHPSNPLLLLAGFLSGLMGTITSIGGPPMGLVYQNKEGPILRGTLSGFFLIGSLFSIIVLAIIGKIGFYELQLFFIIIPPLLIGFFISYFTSKLLDKGFIRYVILIICTISASVVITKIIWHFFNKTI